MAAVIDRAAGASSLRVLLVHKINECTAEHRQGGDSVIEVSTPPMVAKARDLAASIAAEIDALRSRAAESRLVVEGLSRTDGDHTSALADLIDAIDRAEVAKVVALEGELVAVDEALEAAVSACDASRVASTEYSDANLEDVFPGLVAALDAARARIAALPPGPIADTTLVVVPLRPTTPSDGPLAAVVTSFASATHLDLLPVPHFVNPDAALELQLVLTATARATLGGTKEVAAAVLQATAARICVFGRRESGSSYTAPRVKSEHTSAPVLASVVVTDAGLSVMVPQASPTPDGSAGSGPDSEIFFILDAVTVAGIAVVSPSLPSRVRISAVRGVTAPSSLCRASSTTTTPFVTALGEVFVAYGSKLLRFDPSAKELPSWSSSSLGFSNMLYAGVFDDATGTLLLGDWSGDSSSLAAFSYARRPSGNSLTHLAESGDTSSHLLKAAADAVATPLWRTARGSFLNCDCIVMLDQTRTTALGRRVAASSRDDHSIHIHDLHTGARVSSVKLDVGTRNLAFDAASSTLFISSPCNGVYAMQWDAVTDALRLLTWDVQPLGTPVAAVPTEVLRPSRLFEDTSGRGSSALPLIAVMKRGAAAGSLLLCARWGESAVDVRRVGVGFELLGSVPLASLEQPEPDKPTPELLGFTCDALGEALVLVCRSTICTVPWRGHDFTVAGTVVS